MKTSYLEQRKKKKIIKMVSPHLKKIYTTAKSIANDWDKKTIPLTTLRIIIDKSKLKPSGVKENDVFIVQFNNTIESLHTSLTDIAKKMDSKSIPVSKIKEGIEVINTSFKSTLMKKQNESTN
jgi:septation ring formation regulator EzrA